MWPGSEHNQNTRSWLHVVCLGNLEASYIKECGFKVNNNYALAVPSHMLQLCSMFCNMKIFMRKPANNWCMSLHVVCDVISLNR